MKVKEAIFKAGKQLLFSIPVLISTVLAVSFASALIPKSFYASLFSKNILLDSFIGSSVGSISAGNPITSYIIGGEMLNQGVSLVAVSAFLVAWVSVGILQFPAEASTLGAKFAVLRNLSAFILTVVVAIITVFILGLI